MSRASGLPSSNRGVSENERTEEVRCTVDWLAVSLDLFGTLEGTGWDGSRNLVSADLASAGLLVMETASQIVRHLFGETFTLDKPKPGKFYTWRVSLRGANDTHVGLIEMGGPHTIREDGTHTCRLELTGDGCRMYEASMSGDHAKRWSPLASMLGLCGARITRIDIAADDFLGFRPMRWALDCYNGGGFDKRGQRPNAQLIDDMESGAGKTLYVGSRKSENRLRIYEKGKEQGDKESPWMRYEGEFHASNRRALPLDMIMHPDGYLLGAYPALDFIQGMGERLRIARESMLASAKRAVAHLRRQYGPMLNAMMQASQGDEDTLYRMVAGCSRSKLPGWCTDQEAVGQLLVAILRNVETESEPGGIDADGFYQPRHNGATQSQED